MITIIACSLVAFIVGFCVGEWTSEKSICRTIEKLGFRTINSSTRIYGRIQKGTYE